MGERAVIRDPDRFTAGQEFNFDGIQFRIVAGTKALGDLVIQWLTMDGWRAITCQPLFLAIDFIAWNEDLLYPPPLAGGDLLLDALRVARVKGYREACARLDEDRWRAARRRKAQSESTPGGGRDDGEQ